MISELSKLIEKFPGPSNRTRCFNHVLAIVAVRIVRNFDVPTEGSDMFMDDAEEELRELAEGLDLEEDETQRNREEGETEEADDDPEDWIHAHRKLSAVDRDALDESMRPIRTLMVKVS